MNKEEQRVLSLNDSKESYLYCLHNEDANVKLHEDIIVNNEDAFYACYFAKNIKAADIERLQEVVINREQSWNIYWFAFYVEKSNKEELFRALLKIGDKDHINLFIKNIPISEELKALIIFI